MQTNPNGPRRLQQADGKRLEPRYADGEKNDASPILTGPEPHERARQLQRMGSTIPRENVEMIALESRA